MLNSEHFIFTVHTSQSNLPLWLLAIAGMPDADF